MTSKIIGLSGRIHSGKTMLSNICQEFGYKRIFVAHAVKSLIATLLNTDIDGTNKLKNVEINYRPTIDDIQYISTVTDIPEDIVFEVTKNNKFKTVRDMLQIIGTELIRGYNENWHIEKMFESMTPGENYVVDDVRFINEMNFIKEHNGDTWFIVRPSMVNLSSHSSENTLKWQMFDNIIINDGSKNDLETRWRNFISEYDKMYTFKKELQKSNKNAVSEEHFLSKHLLTYDNRFENLTNLDDITFNETEKTIHYLNEKFTNPLMIEDLKCSICNIQNKVGI